MKNKHYLIIGVIAYLLFVGVNFPASSVYGLVESRAPMVKAQSISGTLWQGNALKIVVQNKHQLSNVSWSVSPWSLLLGQLSIDTEASYLNEKISGNITASILGNVSASNLKAGFPAEKIAQFAPIPVGQFDGKISINLDSLSLAENNIPSAEGTITWSKAAITVAEKASLGNISIRISEDDTNPLTANISNQGGDISISGNAVVTSDSKYTIDLKLQPKSTASKNLKSTLGFIAKKQPDGSFQLKNSGNLKKLGLM